MVPGARAGLGPSPFEGILATNPRIDDLRKRLEKEPGSRVFAQLAEELRKDGELEEAIRVAREGLQKHPAYPSARMTLGRALLDTGDWAAARTEFELVVKSAPDNILASRYLGECLESLGERDAAIARYKATLAMAPSEKHVVARLAELERGGGGPARPAATLPAAEPRSGTLRPATGAVAKPPMPPMPAVAPPPPPPPIPVPPPPIPLAVVEGEMELETSRQATGAGAAPGAAAPATGSFAPIPVAAADDEFELERPYESPITGIGSVPSAAAPPPAAVPPEAPAASAPAAPAAEDQEFELEAPHEAPSVGWAATIRPLPVVEEPPAPRATAVPVPPSAPASVPVPPPPSAPAAAELLVPSTLTSPTLGELYFNQGFTDKAIEVYRDLAAREPENQRLQARLLELEKLHRSLSGTEPAAPPPPPPPMAAPVTPPAVAAPPAAPPMVAPPTPPPMAAPPTPPPMAAPPPAPPPPTTVLPVTPPPAAPELSPAEGPAADRRQAIERTIARLEGLLSAIRKG